MKRLTLRRDQGWMTRLRSVKISRTTKIVLLTTLIFLGILVALIKHGSKETIADMKLKGEILFSQGDYEKAIHVWKRVIKRVPSDVEIHIQLARSYLKLANWKKARERLERARALSHGAETLGIDIELAKIDLLSGDLVAAEAVGRRLIAAWPEDPEVNVLFGDIHLLKGAFDLAEGVYKKAHAIEPASARYALKLAVCLVAEGALERAKPYVTLAAVTVDRSVETVSQMAEYYVLIGAYHEAEQYMKKALSMAPEDVGLKIRLGRFYFMAGKLTEAEKMLVEIASRQPNNDALKKMLADIYISLNRLDDAAILINEIKRLTGDDDPEYNLIQGKYWLFMGRPVYAITHLENAVALQPGLIFARYLLSVAYLAAGKAQLAENSVTKTLMYDPNHIPSQLLMAMILQRKEAYVLSDEYLDRIFDQEASHFNALMLRGGNALALREIDDAVTAFTRASALDQGAVSPLYFLGVALETGGRLVEARQSYEKALEMGHMSADLSYRYAMLLLDMGDEHEALLFVDQLLETHRDAPDAHYIAAKVKAKTGAVPSAISILEQAISNLPSPAYLYLELAAMHESEGCLKSAIDVAKRLVEAHPYQEDGWLAIARYYLSAGKKDAAMDQLEKAEQKLPSSPKILSNLAWLYLENEIQLDLALEYARSAYEKIPDAPAVADTLGWAYYKKGLFSQATWMFEAIEERDPENPLVLYHLGMSLYREGRLPEALHRLKRFLAQPRKGNTSAVEEIVACTVGHIEKKERSRGDDRLNFDTDGSGLTDHTLERETLFDFPSAHDDDDILEPQWRDQPASVENGR